MRDLSTRSGIRISVQKRENLLEICGTSFGQPSATGADVEFATLGRERAADRNDAWNRLFGTVLFFYGGDKAGTLDASYYKGAGARNGKEREFVAERKAGRKYIVRRLSTTECARLQGLPDCWAIPVHKEDMTDEEAVFWEKVRETHAAINGTRYKPFSKREQLVRWYNRLHTDSAEYKLYGNGIALPCAVYVLRGIAQVIREKEGEEQT